MSIKTWVALAVVLTGLVSLVVLIVQASPPQQLPQLQGGVRTQGGAVGTGFTYQGQLKTGGEPVNEDCEMAFRLYDGASGGNQVGSAITTTVPISDGLFTVVLNFGSGVFDGGARWLGIRVQCPGDAGYADLGRQALTAVPYALYALDTQGYAGVVTVAKSGGDYTNIQAAIDSITDAAADNPYLVWVAPGVYNETVTMKPYVHVQGAGQEATVITSTVSNGSFPPTQATLALSSDASLRDLTVGNGGAGSYNAALLAVTGTMGTLVADVTAHAQGSGTNNYATFLIGSGTGVTLQGITALGEGGSSRNFGLFNARTASATLRGGSFTARGGDYAIGILSYDSNTTLEAENVSALGENGSADNYGLLNGNGAAMTLYGGSFTGRGGVNPFGIANNDSGTTLVAESVTALAENGSGEIYGLGNYISATATLRGGSFTGRGGTIAYGITNGASSTTLEAEGVSALGENGSDTNYGLLNFDGAEATLSKGSFTGRGGNNARGIYNDGSTLEATAVTVLAEDCSSTNYGLFNDNGASAALRGGSFTGHGGSTARGIYNDGSGTALEATGITALGEDGSSTHGLHNSTGALATLHDGSFTGRGGSNAYGILNGSAGNTLEATGVTALGENGTASSSGLLSSAGASTVLRGGSFTGRGGNSAYGIWHASSATLEATSVTALAEDGVPNNYGLNQTGGTVRLGVTQLVGGTNWGGVGRTCFQVYDGSFAGISCP